MKYKYIYIYVWLLCVSMDQQPALTQTTQPYPWYQNLSKGLFQGESEKSLVDKLLGRQDADKLHALMQKEPLNRSDIEEILFLMTSIDQKILNYDEWDRYIIIKLFPWVKDYSTICKTWMLYEEQYNQGNFDNDFTTTIKIKDEKTGEEVEQTIKVKDTEGNEKNVVFKPVLEETKRIIAEISKYLQHNLKFLISVFLLVSNSTLSIDGAAFETITTQRFEYSYPNIPLPQPQQRGNVFANMLSKRK